MRLSRPGRILMPLAVAVAGSLAWSWQPGLLRGQGSGRVTWSGRIRVEKRLTTKSQCTNCEHDVHEFSGEEYYVTEYQLERVPPTAEAQWSSNDVRVQVRGTHHSRSHGVNTRSDAQLRESVIATQETGSGNTVAGVSIFLRLAGEEDEGHCRLEFGPIGERDDNGPLTQPIKMQGEEHQRFRYKDHEPHDESKPHETEMMPDGDQLDAPCAPKARSLRGDEIRMNANGRYVRVSWDLVQDGEAVTEVVMSPGNGYDQWLPQAGEREADIGDFIDVRVVAQEKGKPGSKPPQKVKKYKVQLVDVSKEPGVCLNWPQSPSGEPGYDLKLDKENPYINLLDKDGQSAETKEVGLEEFMVTVNAHDWGAYGKLQVTAELEDGSTVPAHVENKASEFALALPKDDDSNHIADWWEHWFEVKDKTPQADAETSPMGDEHEGDSISFYEEYRGFRVQGKHARLSPTWKDVFFYDRDNLGLGYFGALGLHSHSVTRQELTMVAGSGNNWRVNGNHGTHSLGTVWAVRMIRQALGDGGTGETLPGPGVPSTIVEVRIDPAAIAASGVPDVDAELKSSIAHELGHATNIRHHSDGLDYRAGDVLCRKRTGKQEGTVVNFLCDDKEQGCFLVAVQHGAFSGDDKCVMRYNSGNFYEDAGGNCEWTFEGKRVRGFVYDADPPGTIYCASRKGTGVNDTSKKPNKAGDAVDDGGRCEYKFCVNSRKH